LEDLYISFGWPFNKKFGHAYDAFKSVISEPSILDSLNPPIDPLIKEILLKDINKRLTPQAATHRAEFEVTCFEYGGIDAIKAALMKAQAVGNAEIPIKINLVAPPMFVMNVTSYDKETGLKLMEEALQVATTEIKNSRGNLVVNNKSFKILEIQELELECE